MKWIITGGAGFIGTNAAEYLSRRGHECVLADNFHRPGSRLNQAYLGDKCGLQVHRIDVRDSSQVNALWAAHKDAAMVLHLAGQVSFVASISDPRYDFETNVLGTFNALEATRTFTPGARLIYSSSNKVYGDLSAIRFEEQSTRYTLPDFPRGLPEELALELHGGYSCSKGAADQYVRDYHATYGLKTVSLRQSSVYGGRQFASEDQGWVAYFVKMGVEGLPFRISGAGKQVRDLLYVADLCACFENIAELDRDSAAFGQAFNIGGGAGNSLSLLELFAHLRETYGFRLQYTAGPPRVCDQKVFMADIAKAGRLLGWQPRTSVPTGIEDLVAWSRRAFFLPAKTNHQVH